MYRISHGSNGKKRKLATNTMDSAFLHMQLTFTKSSIVALISFHVLLRRMMQIQKNSSNGRSCVKNMGW
jgi:hypothetical protein